MPRTSNNAIGKARRDRALEELAKTPLTTRQQAELGLWLNADIARKKMHQFEPLGLVNRVGTVNLRGYWEFLWYVGKVNHRQHEGEMSEISLGIAKVGTEIKRLFEVDDQLRPDAEIYVNGVLSYYWEHEASGSLNLKQIQAKFERYGGQNVYVLWTCRNRTYLDKLARHATTDRHLFTTTELAMERFHEDIWVDRNGKTYSLPFTDRTSPMSTDAAHGIGDNE